MLCIDFWGYYYSVHNKNYSKYKLNKHRDFDAAWIFKSRIKWYAKFPFPLEFCPSSYFLGSAIFTIPAKSARIQKTFNFYPSPGLHPWFLMTDLCAHRRLTKQGKSNFKVKKLILHPPPLPWLQSVRKFCELYLHNTARINHSLPLQLLPYSSKPLPPLV